MKIVDESILFFSRVSLSKLSLEAIYISWDNGIYSKVYKECERSVLIKQGILATCQSRDLVARLFLSAHFLSFFHTLSHTTRT